MLFRSLLIRVSVAAHPREQARVVHDASVSIVHGRALSQPQRDQTRPDHVLHRLPETQVGPQRQQGNKLSAANPCASLRPCRTSLSHRRRLTPDVASLQPADNRAEWPTTWIDERHGHPSATRDATSSRTATTLPIQANRGAHDTVDGVRGHASRTARVRFVRSVSTPRLPRPTAAAAVPRTASRPPRTARTDNGPDLTVKARSRPGPTRSTEPDVMRVIEDHPSPSGV